MEEQMHNSVTDCLLMVLDIAMTDSQIVDQMRTMRAFRMPRKDSMILATIRNFDHDPRELWEVPEVQFFCRRLLAMGYISWLDPQCEPLPGEPPGRPFSALDIWLLSEGRLKPTVIVDSAEFRQALIESNVISDHTLSR
jgi:hypothetical protein